MQIKVECSYCKEKFTVGGEGVEVSLRNIQSRDDGKILTATYFYCPKCNTEHVVQLDDEYSLNLLECVTSMLKSKVKLALVGKNVTEAMKREFKQKRALLAEYRTGLMAKYHGTCFIEKTGVKPGAEFGLRCTTGCVAEGGHYGEE